jgi:hypothetical protein
MMARFTFLLARVLSGLGVDLFQQREQVGSDGSRGDDETNVGGDE